MGLFIAESIRKREFGKQIPGEDIITLQDGARISLAQQIAGKGLPKGTRLLKVYSTTKQGPRRILYLLVVGNGDLFVLFYRDKNDPVGENMTQKNPAFTADLHLNIPARHRATGLTNLEALALEVRDRNPDTVVVAGDIGIPERAPEFLSALRRVAGNRPLAFCLGNHDHWIDPSQHHRFTNLFQIRDMVWEPSAEAIGAMLLDSENAYWKDVTICGGYGHFDLGHAEPKLSIRGRCVTRSDYLAGGTDGAYWNDFALIPGCAAATKEFTHCFPNEMSLSSV